MKRIASFLFFLCSVPAWAHEPSFTSLWFQPLPSIATFVTGGHVFSLGGTKGVVPGLDVMAELTFFGAQDNTCDSRPGCRDRLTGLIATAGVAWTTTLNSGPTWEVGGFVGPKALWATTSESGVPGGPQPPPNEPAELQFAPGRATEIGGGVDVGIELHTKPGLYAAFVIGLHVARVLNHGDFATSNESYSSGPATPTNPVRLLVSPSSGTRRDSVQVGFNLNLVRVGYNF